MLLLDRKFCTYGPFFQYWKYVVLYISFASMIPLEKSFQLNYLTLLGKVLFLSCYQNISFVFGFWKFYYDLSGCRLLWGYEMWICFSLLSLQAFVFCQMFSDMI